MQSRGLLRNVLTLVGVKGAQQLIPLATVPFLTRTLGVDGFGLVAIAQAIGVVVQLVVEFGFEFSATRDVARARTMPNHVGRLVTEVSAAKGMLAIFTVLVAALVATILPFAREEPLLFLGGVGLGLSRGLNLNWLFQGLERMNVLAALEIGSRLGAAILIFATIRTPEDVWMVPFLFAVPSGIAIVASFVLAARSFDLGRFSLKAAVDKIRQSWRLFGFRASSSLYTTANTLILAAVASSETVGLFAAAEKLVRAVLGLVTPVGQALLPRQSYLVAHDRAAAARLARKTITILAGGSIAAAIILAVTARPLLLATLGPDFGDAKPIFQILLVMLPLVAASNVLGVQWILPLGKDDRFLAIVLSAGLLNLVVAPLLAWRYEAIGIALAAVLAEAVVTTMMLISLFRDRIDPWTLGSKEYSA